MQDTDAFLAVSQIRLVDFQVEISWHNQYRPNRFSCLNPQGHRIAVAVLVGHSQRMSEILINFAKAFRHIGRSVEGGGRHLTIELHTDQPDSAAANGLRTGSNEITTRAVRRCVVPDTNKPSHKGGAPTAVARC